MTEIEQKAVDEMAKQMYKQFIDKFNYVPLCDYENATLDGLPFLEIAQCLLELGYRPEAEVRAEAVKEFAEKVKASVCENAYTVYYDKFSSDNGITEDGFNELIDNLLKQYEVEE